MALPSKRMRYTFADALTWEENQRIEIIDGEAVMMAPPVRIHQEISGELFFQLANYLRGKGCKVYAAPFAVRLFEKDGEDPEDVDTMVEPDIAVICDPAKLDKYGCRGAPDTGLQNSACTSGPACVSTGSWTRRTNLCSPSGWRTAATL